jgi:nucleoside-diphosphate-sugar epimerase
MRLLLDVHVSGRVVGRALADAGHDVRALDSEPEGLDDPAALELAAREGRVLVTANVGDFERLLTERAGEGRSHAGVILVPRSVRNETFDVLVSGIEKTIADTEQAGWVDRVEWLKKVCRAG